MPADKIDLALQLESDRMQNSIFDPEEVASERTVIISEREGNENSPMFKLSEATQAAAFRIFWVNKSLSLACLYSGASAEDANRVIVKNV